MPSVPVAPSALHAPITQLPNPNASVDHDAHIRIDPVAHKPSPAVVASSSTHVHSLPRRFIGPMPEAVVNSEATEDEYKRLREIRRRALKMIPGHWDQESEAASQRMENGKRAVVRQVRRIRVKRIGRKGEEVEQDFELGSDSEEEEGNHLLQLGKKKKKRRKDVWVGESFDIGREFKSPPTPAESAIPGSSTGRVTPDEAKGSVITRPATSRTTTQESFVTARTALSPTTTRNEPPRRGNGDARPRSEGSESEGEHPEYRHSGASSRQPLIDAPIDEDPPVSEARAGKGKGRASEASLKGESIATPKLASRLKSALRKASVSSIKTDSPDAARKVERNKPAAKPKTVQFPVDLEEHTADGEPPRKGNKAPAHPKEVLGRTGEEAEGTSHHAAEQAINEEDEEDDEVLLPGDVIMRDRMLVRVAYHREDNIPIYDEEAQRRNPCSRIESLEEYIVVWRRGRVEFYQDWNIPFKEMVQKQKQLCFIVPLTPTRSSLSIFNDTDLTLSLATSAGRLNEEVEHILRSNTTRSSAIKNRVAQSRQVEWLRRGGRGTHIFVMKLSQRSRAMDWFWEMWRELGGELPHRIDIRVPALSTSIRLRLPDDEEVGGRVVRSALNPKVTVRTCYDMLSGAVDVETMLGERGQKAHDLKLVWRGIGTSLDWLAYDTTVQGKRRDWGVLAGLARVQIERHPRVLQIRPEQHQPSVLRLEDGTLLEEPPSIEGYLTQHHAGATSKDKIYVATHDGNVFISSKGHAQPPLPPRREGSTPADLFPQVHESFLEREHQRMAAFIERSAGCFDLRSVSSVRLTVDLEAEEAGKKAERRFEVETTSGDTFTLEAHSREDAKEWVERLKSLVSYWKRHHRVDARQRMDAMELKSDGDDLNSGGDRVLADIWDWCIIKGCRSITVSGRLYMKKGKWDKFRLRLVVLTGGCLVVYKVKSTQAFQTRKKAYPLFGAYVYSGMLAEDELHEKIEEGAFDNRARVYQDGLQSSDGAEDTTLVVRLVAKPRTWGKKRTQPWEAIGKHVHPPPLTTKPPVLLIFRARSKLERDRWVWAINAELERQARGHVKEEDALRNLGLIPKR